MPRYIDADALAEKKFQESECKGFGEGAAYRQGWNDAIDAIVDNEPSVELPHWIPVSERMPEEDYCTGRGIQHSATVLVTVVNHGACDDTFVDMACTVDGEWQLTYPQDDDPDIPKWCKIIAWMSLPEPWEGANHENRNRS